MTNFKGLAHIGLHTANSEESVKFYTENLGFKYEYEHIIEKPNNEWMKLTFISLNGMVIELLEPSDKTAVKSGNSGCVDHLTIEVKNLNEIVSTLKSKGIAFETEQPIQMPTLKNGAQLIFFRGPSDERLELFEYLG